MIGDPSEPMDCPACRVRMQMQDPYTQGIRRYQHFICDNHDCRVSSIRVEWRAII